MEEVQIQQIRLAALQLAVGTIQSGIKPVSLDPVTLANEYIKFIQGN